MTSPLSLGTAAARNLATTTKSVPQAAAITPRWLLRMLPWVHVDSATYRVNRRRSYRLDDGRVGFVAEGGGRRRAVARELRELPLLRGFDDPAVLGTLADRFEQREFAAGETIVERGDRSDPVFLIAHGRAHQLGPGEYGERTLRGVLGPGDHFGDRTLLEPDSRWELTVRAATPGTLLTMSQRTFDELVGRFSPLRAHLTRRLTAEALRERQEYELVNNPEFGLLATVDPRQQLHPRAGPPTPDDLDQLLSRRRRSRFFLAHPRTIAAFGRECTRRGVYPDPVRVHGRPVTAWRGVPILPCDKLPVSPTHTSPVLVLRTGEEHQGVIGLRRAGVPDVSVRFAGVDTRGVASYLLSTYYSVAVPVADALGVLENVEIGLPMEET
jgi:CRP-like cAMP-binding protein